MKLLPLLLFVCFVLYEVLQVDGKSKQDAVKKLLQKYIHHHHKHHHVHHHHSHHHHHHHHHRKHHHHKHWHHHHHHHHKSFHQKLVEKLRKEKQKQQHHVGKATKRESLPQLLVSLGKGFMQLGKHLRKNQSYPDTQAARTATIKNVPTPKHLVHDHVATTQAARAFATPSPTSEYYSENNEGDDIGGDALTPAPLMPTASQKVMSSGDAPQSNKKEQERTTRHHKNVDSPIITPTPQSEPSPIQSANSQANTDDISTPLDNDSSHSRTQGMRVPQHENADSPTVTPTQISPSPSPKSQATPGDFDPSQSDDEEYPLNTTLDSTASRMSKHRQDPSVKSTMASVSDKENEPLLSKDGLDRPKGIDEHRDSSEPKIPGVKGEESVPNPSIEIPADQARFLGQHSPTESAIDGREDESFRSEQGNQFANSTSSENSSPNLFVSSEPSIDAGNRVEMNATQSTDQVEEKPGLEDDLSSIDETKGSAEVSTTEDLPVTDSIELHGDQTKGPAETTSQDKVQIVETKSHENSDGSPSVATERNLNTDPKAETNSSASSDEIMDGEVSPSEIVAENTDDLTSRSSTPLPTAAGLKPSTESEQSDSDITTHKATTKQVTESQYSESTLDGTTPSMSQDPEHSVANQTSLETSSIVDGTNEAVSSSSVSDDTEAKAIPKESDSTTVQMKTSQATSSSVDDTEGQAIPKGSDSTTVQMKTEPQATSSDDDDSATTSLSVDSTTNQMKVSQPTTQPDDDSATTSPFAESDSTAHQMKSSTSSTQPGSTGEELVQPSTQESDSTTTDGEVQSVQASRHEGDDITGGVTKQPRNDAEALEDGSGATEDAATSDLDDGKTGAEVANSQFPNERNESSQEAPVTNVASNSENPTLYPQPMSSETPSQVGERSDDLRSATHQAPVYQNYTNFDSQENDGAAQSSEVPIDEAYIPAVARLADDTMQDEQNRKVDYSGRVVNTFPSEIEDGEVLPPNMSNTSNATVPAVYN